MVAVAAESRGEDDEMGKPIRIRAKMKGDVAEVKALMPHVMESGFRRDPETDEVIREIPPEEIRNMSKHLGEANGLLFHNKA